MSDREREVPIEKRYLKYLIVFLRPIFIFIFGDQFRTLFAFDILGLQINGSSKGIFLYIIFDWDFDNLIFLLVEIFKDRNLTVFCFQGNIYCTLLCKLFGIKIFNSNWELNRVSDCKKNISK